MWKEIVKAEVKRILGKEDNKLLNNKQLLEHDAIKAISIDIRKASQSGKTPTDGEVIKYFRQTRSDHYRST